ncbi:MAG TPA: hypothetical protein VGD39_09725 [Nocardioides sp.]
MSNPDKLPPAQQRALRILAGRLRGSVQSQTWQALERRGLVRWYHDNGDKWELTEAGRDAANRLPADRDELIRLLFAVYDTWSNQIATYEPSGNLIEQGIASLLTIEDSRAMEAVTDAVAPHKARIRELLGGDTRA